MIRRKKTLPSFEFEMSLDDGFVVIGVDEVGRGALAGPVVAGAVCLLGDRGFWLKQGIDDSKRLSAIRREELSKIIWKNAACGIGGVSVAYINSHGIVKATEKAMRQAIKAVQGKIASNQGQFLLIDAFNLMFVPKIGLKQQKAIIKGDQKSISIAAASIIAKVYRDKLMDELAYKQTRYGLDGNKGYGTKLHIEAIKHHGVSKIHRKLFVRGFII